MTVVNIIVTTPKSERQTAQEEAEAVKNNPDAFWFRSFRFKPKVNVGDRVYYVDNGEIRGYGIIFDIETGEMWDEISWTGTHLKQREWVWLKKPVPFSGFQGLRYVKDELAKQLMDAEK